MSLPERGFASILLLAGLLAAGCRSTPCWEGHEALADSPGGEPYWCPWSYPNGRGDEPSWQTGYSKNGTMFVGEGIDKNKQEAIRKAEAAMRASVAAAQGTDVYSVAVFRLRTDGEKEQVRFGQDERVQVNQTVTIPPDGTYAVLRERVGYQYGTELQLRQWRVLVMAEIGR